MDIEKVKFIVRSARRKFTNTGRIRHTGFGDISYITENENYTGDDFDFLILVAEMLHERFVSGEVFIDFYKAKTLHGVKYFCSIEDFWYGGDGEEEIMISSDGKLQYKNDSFYEKHGIISIKEVFMPLLILERAFKKFILKK